MYRCIYKIHQISMKNCKLVILTTVVVVIFKRKRNSMFGNLFGCKSERTGLSRHVTMTSNHACANTSPFTEPKDLSRQRLSHAWILLLWFCQAIHRSAFASMGPSLPRVTPMEPVFFFHQPDEVPRWKKERRKKKESKLISAPSSGKHLSIECFAL